MNHDWLTHLKNSPVAHRNQHLFEKPKQKRKPNKPKKELLYVTALITEWCETNNLEFRVEYKFHEYRKFRFDFAIPQIKVAVEYEGLNSEKSGHTTLTGYTKDTEKYNLALSEGWKVLRFTVLNYKTVIQELEKFND